MKDFKIDLIFNDIPNQIEITHTYHGKVGTFYDYDEILVDAYKKLGQFIKNTNPTTEVVYELHKVVFRFLTQLRKEFACMPHQRKTFKKELMARGHSPREAEAICKIIGSFGGELRYDWIGYTFALVVLKDLDFFPDKEEMIHNRCYEM